MASAQTVCHTRSRGLSVGSLQISDGACNKQLLPPAPVNSLCHSKGALGCPDTILSSQQRKFAYPGKTHRSYLTSRAVQRNCWSSLRSSLQHQDRNLARHPKLLQRRAFLNGKSLGHKSFPLKLTSDVSSTLVKPPSRHRSASTVRCQAAPKIANLTASRSMTVPLPVHSDSEGRPRTLSEFLSLPVGRESMLKGQSCKRRELIDENTFRCYLRSIEAFKFSVSPVIDVRVTSTDDTCTVEMLQCRFLGSEAVERQNNRFSASFRNYIDWRENGAPERKLQNEITLDLALEVFTPPFTMLPLGAVERPGSAFLQALLDRVAPAFVDSLLADYKAWAKGELDESDTLSLEENRSQRSHVGSDLD